MHACIHTYIHSSFIHSFIHTFKQHTFKHTQLPSSGRPSLHCRRSTTHRQNNQRSIHQQPICTHTCLRAHTHTPCAHRQGCRDHGQVFARFFGNLGQLWLFANFGAATRAGLARDRALLRALCACPLYHRHCCACRRGGHQERGRHGCVHVRSDSHAHTRPSQQPRNKGTEKRGR
jgi:hypothetical protein